MRRFFCNCGQEIFLENKLCLQCGCPVAYLPSENTMVSLEPRGSGWQVAASGQAVILCNNREAYNVCNAVTESSTHSAQCLACRLNRTIPDLSNPGNLARWSKLEEAKRRLLYGLLRLGLPLEAPVNGFPRGLCFDFIEDQRSNPEAPVEFVMTGHAEGVITINVLEADDVQRAWQREQSSERYRTLLGHLRHEVGHYYFELLVRDTATFLRLFGDHTQPYDKALVRYYQHGPLAGWEKSHISAYASAHPLEDWAESFAHYLHMIDTLETASQRGAISPLGGDESIRQLLALWDEFSVTLNELNRSLGLRDAYPFVVNAVVADKLHFIHSCITQYPTA